MIVAGPLQWGQVKALFGREALRTTDVIDMPMSNPKRINVAPGDRHPSSWGLEFYAQAVSTMLIREGLLP
jgi:hypothetical protein